MLSSSLSPTIQIPLNAILKFQLKADRLHPGNYLHTPTDYGQTDKYLRLVMTLIALCCTRQSWAPNVDHCAPEIWPWPVTLTTTFDLWPWPTIQAYSGSRWPQCQKSRLKVKRFSQESTHKRTNATLSTSFAIDNYNLVWHYTEYTRRADLHNYSMCPMRLYRNWLDFWKVLTFNEHASYAGLVAVTKER